MSLMMNVIFSSPDMILQEIESSSLENLKLHSLLNLTSMLKAKFPEDHLTIPQDQSEEMIASNQELLKLSEPTGEPSLELKTLLSSPDKDLLPDQVTTLMKLSIPST
jgi:hypothetical protein